MFTAAGGRLALFSANRSYLDIRKRLSNVPRTSTPAVFLAGAIRTTPHIEPQS